METQSLLLGLCGLKEFQLKLPCHSTELVHFRKRIVAEEFLKTCHFFLIIF